jgi:hypothetical protein
VNVVVVVVVVVVNVNVNVVVVVVVENVVWIGLLLLFLLCIGPKTQVLVVVEQTHLQNCIYVRIYFKEFDFIVMTQLPSNKRELLRVFLFVEESGMSGMAACQ